MSKTLPAPAESVRPALPRRSSRSVNAWLAAFALTFTACDEGGSGSEDADAATPDAGGGTTADAGGGTTVDAGPTPDDAAVTRSAPPVPPDTSSSADYTLYVNGGGHLYVYWRDASDDETAASALGYAVRVAVDGGTESTAYGFETASGIAREGSSRMLALAVSGPLTPGTYSVWIVVRDEDGNETEYPHLDYVEPPIGCLGCR